MGLDAVALLRIRRLPAPVSAQGIEHLVEHRRDATLLHTLNRFHGTAADEHALALRQLLGAQLDAHDDPRGILFFADACEPSGKTYDEIVAQVGSAGTWAPMVQSGHVPARYREAAPGTHEALVAQMVEKMGRDPAIELDMMAQVHLLVLEATNGRPDAVADYQAVIDKLTAALGSGFAERYTQALRKKL
jgi:hypothetical protein